jgi:antagonist of KipI
MSIRIIKPGLLTTIQDAGRTGHRSIGVGSAGAMDLFAMKVANYLCGNNGNEPVIEIHFPGPEILFEQDAIISLAGGDFSAKLNEKTVPSWRTVLVKKDSVLRFKHPVSGARAYLAVAGGWEADNWLGSYSTHLKLAVGGHSGRALQKEDALHFLIKSNSFSENKIFPWSISGFELDKTYKPLYNMRCLPGPEYSLLTESAKRTFERQQFIISHQSDRMGYRLDSEPLLLEKPVELISSPVDAGTIQILPTGNGIILMADHQTTGGYPRIGAIIKADLAKLAQVNPGALINFSLVSIKTAEAAFTEMKQNLQEIKQACDINLTNILQG